MTHPTFDRDGYPTDETLAYIKNWNDLENVQGWMDFCLDAMHDVYARVDRRENMVYIATGGWSGNEDVINAMSQNILWRLCWRMSVIGGAYILRVGQGDDPITEHGFDVIRNWFNEAGEKE